MGKEAQDLQKYLQSWILLELQSYCHLKTIPKKRKKSFKHPVQMRIQSKRLKTLKTK